MLRRNNKRNQRRRKGKGRERGRRRRRGSVIAFETREIVLLLLSVCLIQHLYLLFESSIYVFNVTEPY